MKSELRRVVALPVVSSSRCALVSTLTGAALILALAGTASGQTVIVRQLDPNGTTTSAQTHVPGLPNDQTNNGATDRFWAASAFWGVDPFNGQGLNAGYAVPAIDNNGNVMFFGSIATVASVITGGSATIPGNQDGVFVATPSNNYSFAGKSNIILYRDGSTTQSSPQQGGPTPSTAATGVTGASLNNASNGFSGLIGGVSMSSNGAFVGLGFLKGTQTSTATALVQGVNNNVIFTGSVSSGSAVITRRGDGLSGINGFDTTAGSVNRPVALSGITLAGGSGSGVVTQNVTANQLGGGAGGNTSSGGIITNTSGQVFFGGALTGTGIFTTNTGANLNKQNDSGLFLAGSTGGIQKVMHRNEFVDSTNTFVFGLPPTTSRGINSSGNVIFSCPLATATALLTPTGGAATTVASDSSQALWYNIDNGSGGRSNTMFYKANSIVGGTSYLSTCSFVNSTVTTNGAPGGLVPALSNQALNNSNRVLFDASFMGTTTTSTVITAGAANSEALVTWTPSGGVNPIFRTGSDQVPGMANGVTFKSFKENLGPNSSRLNNLNHVVVNGIMTVDGVNVTAAANQGLWLTTDLANPGASTSLIARAGQDVSTLFGLAPGALTLGNGDVATFKIAMDNVILAGNSDIVVFQNVLSDTRVGTFAWSPSGGLFGVALSQPNASGPAGDTSILGASYALSELRYDCASNGDGGVQGLNDSGQLVCEVLSGTGGQSIPSPTNSAIVVFQVPAPGSASLALVGLAVAAGRRRRR